MKDFNAKLATAKKTVTDEKSAVAALKTDFDAKEKSATDQEAKLKTSGGTVEAWTP